MHEGLLRVALFLAYGPFLLMLVLYAAALVLKCCGRRDLLRTLVARTSEQRPIPREGDHGH